MARFLKKCVSKDSEASIAEGVMMLARSLRAMSGLPMPVWYQSRLSVVTPQACIIIEQCHA